MPHKPLRVLLLIDSFKMGGAERITAAILPHLDRSQVTPILCTLKTRGESPLIKEIEERGDVPRFDLGAKRMFDPKAFKRLLALLNEQRIDLIHAQLQDATIMAAAASRITGIPVVVTRHIIADNKRNKKMLLRNHLERLSIRTGVKRVITVSDAARDYYAKLVKLPHSHFQTIYNGIDLESFGPAHDKQKERKALGLPEKGTLVTMVGVMRPGKGQEVAIAAAKLLPQTQFVFVGDGYRPEYRAALEAQAQGVSNIHFLGQRMDIPRILGASDISILPSDSEALPTVLIEAGASTLPVVATRVGGVPEIVEDCVTGILIPPQDAVGLANAIRHLLNHPDKAKDMGLRAYKRVHKIFTIENQTRQLTELYQQVVSEVVQSQPKQSQLAA